MQEALLLLFLVIITIIVFIYFTHMNQTDGFIDIEQLRSQYLLRQLKQYSNIGISLLAGKKEGTLGTSANAMLNTLGEKTNTPLVDGKNGLWKSIDKCETIKTMDCSAFDDPEFSKNCGICLDIGENSEKAKATGGLLLLSDDKDAARQNSPAGFLPDYKATIGFCPAKKLVSTKAECLKLQRELLCQKNASYDLPGCSQCYSDTTYSIVDEKASPGVITGSGLISVVGVGILKIEEQGYPAKAGISLDASRPYEYNVRGNESTRIKFSIEPPRNSDPESPTMPYIAGILSGETNTGTFTSDMRKIVLVDEVTGRKPRANGNDTLSGTPVIKMAPGFGQTKAVIVVIVPFTFVETTMEEGTMCKDAPFVIKQSSAEFLESDPCYKKGSGPGKFSLECLQGIWTSNGCNESGKGYPKDTTAAGTLMTGSDGTFLTLNDISDYIYNRALITSTGIDGTGKTVAIKDQSAASVFCTGREITSPCDTANKDSGPLLPECIVYLWNNQGSKKLWNGKDDPIGPTYYPSNSVSAFSQGQVSRSCQAAGTLSPIDENGNKRKDVIQYWQKQGGIESVKRIMADLHRAANAQQAADDKLAPYFKQCYGDIQFAARPASVFRCSTSVLPLSFIPKANTVLVPSLTMTQDYKMEFDITPSAMGQAGAWRGIIHFTSDGGDASSFGSRTPAIWFWPDTLDLHVRIGDSTSLNWGFDKLAGCSIGKTSHVIIECAGINVRVTIDSNVYTLIQPTFRYSGNVKVLGIGPWFPPAQVTITNMCLKLNGNSTVADTRQVNKVEIRNPDTQSFNINTSIPLQGGRRVDANFPNMPTFDACIAAARARYPGENIGVTYLDGTSWIPKNPGTCWAVPMEPFSAGSNPWAWGWKSAFVTSGDMSGIPSVNSIIIAGGIDCLNFSQLVAYDSKGNNVTIGRKTYGSGQWEPASNSSKAVDGNHMPRGHPNEYHSSGEACGRVSHWTVVLDKPTTISAVIVYNRADCCAERLAKFNLHMHNSAGDLLYWKPSIGTSQVNLIKTDATTNMVSQVKNKGLIPYCYSVRYPDLYNAFDAPYGPSSNSAGLINHWNVYGKKEGRNPNC